MKVLTETEYEKFRDECDIQAAENGADREWGYDAEAELEWYVTDQLGTEMWEVEDETIQ